MCLPSVCSSKTDPVKNNDLSEPLYDSGISSFGFRKNDLQTFSLCLVDVTLELPMLWNLLVHPYVRQFHWGLESLQLHTWKLSSGSSERHIADSVSTDLLKSKSFPHHGKWSRFLHCCRGRNIAPSKTSFQQLTVFFLYLWKDLKLSVLAVRGYRSALNP